MGKDVLAPHEALELHEILRCKQVEIKKMKANMELVHDERIISWMNDCLENSKHCIEEIRDISKKSMMEIGGM